MKKKRIAVLGANQPSLPFYKQARELGYYIVGIAWEEGAVCKQYCDKFYPIDFREKDKVLDACIAEKVNGITSFNLESALPTLIYVAQAMGLVSNSKECIELTCSKYAQRHAFESNQLPVPRFVKVNNELELDQISINFPVVVKPNDSGGSQGITMIKNREELKYAFRLSQKYSPSNEVIIEEYIDGREFSVECISYKGIHYLVQITDKVTSGVPHFIELQHHQPADIPLFVAERIKAMVFKALDALKIENSPSHTEIKLNSRGELYIIEIGARMGGGMITSDLVRLSTGYDMVQGVIELACDNFIQPKYKTLSHSGIFFYSMLSPEVGPIINHKDQFEEIVQSELSEDKLKEVKSNADRIGYVIYQSENKLLTIEYLKSKLECAKQEYEGFDK